MSGTLLERNQPHDLEAEVGVLGSGLLNPNVLDEVALILRASNFYDDANRTLYATMLAMIEDGRRLDVTLLVNRLKRDKTFEQIGGAAYLAKISQGVPNASHAVYYAQIIRQHALLRSLITASADNLSDAYNAAGIDAEDIVERAERRMSGVSEERVESEGEVSDIGDTLRETLELIDARRRGEVTSGIATGFGEVDSLIGGLRPGNLIVIGGRPGHGKTSFAMQIARRAASESSVLFFSLEMSKIELCERFVAQESGIELHRLRNGTMDNPQRERVVEACASIRVDANMAIDDSANRTSTTIAAICRRESRTRRGLGLVVVDYLQLVTPDSPRVPRQEQVAKMSRRFKLLARELGIPVVIVAQLNRESTKADSVADKRPKLSQLRESGAIEQDADIVLLIYKLSPTDKGDLADPVGRVEIIVAKNRQGATGWKDLQWHGPTTTFRNIDRRHGDAAGPDDPDRNVGGSQTEMEY